MAAEKARDGRITNLRALAIIIVVLGHSIILYQDSWTLYTPAQPCAVLNALKNCIDLCWRVIRMFFKNESKPSVAKGNRHRELQKCFSRCLFLYA